MSTALRAKLRSLSASRFLRNRRPFSSIDDGLSGSDYPPEPIPDRPLRKESRPSRPRFPYANRGRGNGNPNSSRGETDSDFLERFKLGLDSKSETPKPDVVEKGTQSKNAEPQSPPEDADEIFRKMKETGLIPNAVAMLDGMCKDGLVQEALKLFGLMREKGAIPEVVVYTAVVEGFCKALKFDDAVRIFKKMQSNGVVPNAISYQVLIKGLCNGKILEGAYEFTVEMLEAGHSPNLATFTGLIDVYCRERGLEEAKNVVAALKLKGFSVEEKAVTEFLNKNGPFLPLVWEAILGKKSSKSSLF
ncbi:hypothetical protein ACS0TY_021890 [Phlomoides rotata]